MKKEEIERSAKDFVDRMFMGWEVFCLVCRGLNCKNNDTCIHCNSKLK